MYLNLKMEFLPISRKKFFIVRHIECNYMSSEYFKMFERLAPQELDEVEEEDDEVFDNLHLIEYFPVRNASLPFAHCIYKKPQVSLQSLYL